MCSGRECLFGEGLTGSRGCPRLGMPRRQMGAVSHTRWSVMARSTYWSTGPLSFPIDLMWEEPRLAQFLNRLSSFSRHIWFDPRGTGAWIGFPTVRVGCLKPWSTTWWRCSTRSAANGAALVELGHADRVVVRGDASRADDRGGDSSTAAPAHFRPRRRDLPAGSFPTKRSIRASNSLVKLVHSAGSWTKRRVSSTTSSSSAGCGAPGGS